MKRQLILGMVLVLLVLIAVGTYFFVDQYTKRKAEKAAEEAAALQLGGFNSNAVTKLDLHTPTLDYVVELDDSGQWVVTNEDVRINSSYISTLCTQGSLIFADQDLGTADDAALESYGLKEPISITYYTDDDTTKLYIGNQSPTKEYFYMMKEGSDHVFLADANVAGYLYVTDSQLRYRYVMHDQESDICQVSLEYNGELRYDLNNNSGEWEMTAPYQVPLAVNNANLNSLFVELLHLEADDFGAPDDTVKTEGGYKFRFTQENGDVTTLLVEDYDTMTTSMVKCLREETGEVFIFDSSYLNFLQSNAGNFLLDTLCAPDINEVTELTFRYEGSFNDKTVSIDDTFVWDTAENSYQRNDTSFSSSEAITAFQSFFSAATSLSYDSMDDTGSLPDDAEPSLTLIYHYQDGSSHEVTLYQKDSKTYWACIDDTFTYAIVRQRELSGEGRMLEMYTKLLEAIDSAEA